MFNLINICYHNLGNFKTTGWFATFCSSPQFYQKPGNVGLQISTPNTTTDIYSSSCGHSNSIYVSPSFQSQVMFIFLILQCEGYLSSSESSISLVLGSVEALIHV